MKKRKEFIQVSIHEFCNFIAFYPNRLERDVCMIGEPPIISYNDFSTNLFWPESMVAKIVTDWVGPNGEIDKKGHKQFYKYYIENKRVDK